MSNAHVEDTLRAMRAANPALKNLKWWPDSEDPRSWKGVRWSDGRVQELTLIGSKLGLSPHIEQLQTLAQLCLYGCPLKELPSEIRQLTALIRLDLQGSKQLKELPPQIGQLTALARLDLQGCRQLKELPPQIGQLLALTSVGLRHCEQLTLAPGAEEGQPAPTIVAAYARLLAEEDAREEARLVIVEPHKDAPEQLHPFLQANPSALPAFVKYIVTDPTHAAWLGEAVKAAPSLAGLTDADGQHAFAFAHWECKQAFEII